jgi:hypothetical protein
MQTEIASEIILTNLKNIAKERAADPSATVASLNQIRMWLIPQKSENDSEYDINRNYFETLAQQTLGELLEKGLIATAILEGVEDGDAHVFSLTRKGEEHVEEAVPNYEQS